MKVLIEKTASSLDNSALKMLFVSVQQNNIDLCTQYAINEYVVFSLSRRNDNNVFFRLADEIGVISAVCPRHRNPNNFVRLNSIQEDLTWRTMLWFGHSLVSKSEYSIR